MYGSASGTELCTDEICKGQLAKIVPQPPCTEQEVCRVILNYEGSVYFTAPSNVNFGRKPIDDTLPGSISSPDRYASTYTTH